MATRTTQWFLSLQMTLYIFLIFVGGSEDADDADDAYKNGRNLVLEYFLPINLPPGLDLTLRREKRDVEGSGEDENVFSELKKVDETDNSTRNALATFSLGEPQGSLADTEGSGEISEDASESLEEKSDSSAVRILQESELFTTEEYTENQNNSTEMIFDKSEDFDEVSTERTEETATVGKEFSPTMMFTNSHVDVEETPTEEPAETTAETLERRQQEFTTPAPEEETTFGKFQTTTEEITTEPISTIPNGGGGGGGGLSEYNLETTTPAAAKTTTFPTTTTIIVETITTELSKLVPIIIPDLAEGSRKAAVDTTTAPRPTERTTTLPAIFPPVVVTNIMEGLPTPSKPTRTSGAVVEEIIDATNIGKKLESVPGNILQKENPSLSADPLLIANTRLMDSEENVQLNSSEPKRLGAYIVIGLILLSFSSLVGYITFKRRMNRKRQEFESNQESNDTEKALLSLSDYKDNSELEENHLKNNEITPIVVKSNSQINKFEKNTNFSSPKNLNTIANEKNIEKDNVLKSTAENLTQVIIEDSPKDVEEEKNVPSLEKLIVKTRIDQDSIPKKPIIINRSSAGYLPIPQDNS